MVVALLGIVVVVFAGACGLAVYRTGENRPIVRALVTFGLLLVTPVIAFWLFSMVATSTLPVLVAIVLLALFGIGLYVVADGTIPHLLSRREQAG